MRDFWQAAPAYGMHPQDLAMVRAEPSKYAHRYVDWNQQEAAANTLPGVQILHVGLHPQPFIGDTETALVFIVHGNPGFSPQDYQDEFANPAHAETCAANLRGAQGGFFPLGPASAGSGAANYWLRVFGKPINELARLRGIAPEDARQLIIRHVAVIESCAYHSGRTPGPWTDELPSSRAAVQHVRQVVLPRARRGESLVIVWRRGAPYWGTGDRNPNIQVRSSHEAQCPTLLARERPLIVNFLNQHAPP